jgi:hypothetical protein
MRGLLGDGAALEGDRIGLPAMTGERAACVSCHRRSGLGSREARSIIPPITGAFLFQQADSSGLPYVEGARPTRHPYTYEALARAIREGVDADGRQMSYLMPRFALGDEDMAALITYLRSLDRPHQPGVSGSELHFATILTPDVSEERRRMVRQVIEQFVADRNNTTRGPAAQTLNTSGATTYAKAMFKVNRRWVLHVWEPEGPPSTWEGQLERSFAQQPVFAVISGIAGRGWPAVSDFCEHRGVPCLFPNVEDPPAQADDSFHTVYFSRGVSLEADLIAAAVTADSAEKASGRIVQVFRSDDVGADAAQVLTRKLEEDGREVVSRPLAIDEPVAAALRNLGSSDILVLWLRGRDLQNLPAQVAAKRVYASGLLGGLESSPLPAAWLDRVYLSYPFDLPQQRRVRVDYARSWLRIRQIPVVDERLQADTYLACGLLSETVKHLVDAFVPDYLVERLEDTVEHRILTGYYPRLTLGPHQRFASKGGFLARFDPSAPGGPRLVAAGDWLTP